MSVSQAEFVAYKAETADRLKKVEDVITKTMEDVKKLQDATDLISIQAAPWSVSIETAVAASETKAQAAPTEVRSLYEGTKAEVEDLRRRATDVEKKTWAPTSQSKKWEMSRPEDMELLSFGAKEEQRPRFREPLKDYAEACHPGIKYQLEYTLKQKVGITHQVLQGSPLGCADESWDLRSDLYTRS